MTNNGILCIIISKFSHKKELSLIILFVIDKNLEIGHYYTVLLLSLVINLRIKGNIELLFDPKEVA